jgi:phosphotransferase system  glucose/maltose/N-acetylglucosamine-specific IIC component
MQEDPSFKPNPDFLRDMFNIVVGIVWQTSLIAFPVYIVIRRYEIAAWAIAVVAVTSIILKFTWYDHLRKMDFDPAYAPVTQPART